MRHALQKRARGKQAQVLVKYIDSLDRAAVITGDFNCTPDSPAMQYFTEQGFVLVQKGDDNQSFQGGSMDEIDPLWRAFAKRAYLHKHL